MTRKLQMIRFCKYGRYSGRLGISVISVASSHLGRIVVDHSGINIYVSNDDWYHIGRYLCSLLINYSISQSASQSVIHTTIQPASQPASQSVSQSFGVIQVVPLGSFVDNIDVDVVTGHLWVAAFPDAQLLVNHLPWPHTPFAPSQVQWTLRSRITPYYRSCNSGCFYYDVCVRVYVCVQGRLCISSYGFG